MLVEIVVGARTTPQLVPRCAAFVRADRQAAAAREERAGLPRQPRARAVSDGGDALRRRGHRARDGRRGGARLRHADGPDRAGRQGGPRHLPGGGQDARARRGAAASASRRWSRRRKLGKKTGQGFYAWVDGKAQKQRGGRRAGRAGRAAHRAAAWREAQAALAEGIVADADLVDAGAIFGTGFAPFRGGPLHYAAQDGSARCAGEDCRAADRTDRTRLACRTPRFAHRGQWRSTTTRCAHARPGRSFVDKIWLKNYRPRRSGRDRPRRVRVGARGLRGKLPQVRDAPRVLVHGRTITFAELDTLSAAFAGYLQGIGCAKGARVALMMPNVLQYPGVRVRHPARGLHGGQRQSAVHAARARAPARRLGRGGHRRRRELRARARRRDRARPRCDRRSSRRSARCSGSRA